MPEQLVRFARDDTAAAAIDYCLIAAAVGLAVFGAVRLAGPVLKDMFSNMAAGAPNTGGGVPIDRNLGK